MPRDLHKPWSEDDEFFREQCLRGKEYEAVVATKLAGYGLHVIHERVGFRPDKYNIKQYTRRAGDLIVKGHRFEVKSRTHAFTSPADWPQSYWPMFVDTVSSFDSKETRPAGYVFLSQPTGMLVGVTAASAPRWTTRRAFDRDRRVTDTFYCVGRNDVLDEAALVAFMHELPSIGVYKAPVIKDLPPPRGIVRVPVDE